MWSFRDLYNKVFEESSGDYEHMSSIGPVNGSYHHAYLTIPMYPFYIPPSVGPFVPLFVWLEAFGVLLVVCIGTGL